MSLYIAEVKAVVAREFGINAIDLESTRRDASRPRLVAYKLCREHTRASYPKLGRAFGGRDHTTILKGIRNIDKQAAKEPELRDRIDTLSARLDQLAAANSGHLTETPDTLPTADH